MLCEPGRKQRPTTAAQAIQMRGMLFRTSGSVNRYCGPEVVFTHTALKRGFLLVSCTQISFCNLQKK